MDELPITIDGKAISAKPGHTILEAALKNGVYIPHLCGHESLAPAGACAMCAVGIKGYEGVVLACSTKVLAGMEIDTRDEMAEKIRKLSSDLLFKTHPSDCTSCPKYGKCQLQTISQYVGDTGRKLRESKLLIAADESNPVIMHEMYRCILCGRCVRVCAEVRGVGAIRFEKVKGRMRVVVDGDTLTDADCRYCSACVDVCPTGSIREHDAIAGKTEGKSRDAALVPCRDACPAHIDVPRYIRHISLGENEAAASVISEKVPFPYVLGYVCTHPCETDCKRGSVNSPVSIRNLKRFAAQSFDKATSPVISKTGPTGKKAAVVGAGPAGLTASFILASKGHDVTVFEESEKAGGMLRYGIPKHRLPREVLDREVGHILAAGVTLKTGTKVRNAPELLKHGFDSVLITVGAHRGARLPIPGANLDGVYVGTEFLRSVEAGTAPRFTGRRVMLLGGGSVALDCAAVVRRLGASEVYLACLERREELPAPDEEVAIALEEGLVIHSGRTFLEIVGEDGCVAGMILAAISGFGFSDNGALSIDVVAGSEELITVDTVIFAIGQRPDIDSGFGLTLDRSGRIEVSDDFETSVPGVFSAGDAVTGTVSVIKAIAGARSAASKIDSYLGGDGIIDKPPEEQRYRDPYLGKISGFGNLKRCDSKLLSPAERVRCFDTMDLGLDSNEAVCEAGRCLRCDLRLDINPQRFWTDYQDI